MGHVDDQEGQSGGDQRCRWRGTVEYEHVQGSSAVRQREIAHHADLIGRNTPIITIAQGLLPLHHGGEGHHHSSQGENPLHMLGSVSRVSLGHHRR
jgi:hypothetical protein